MTVRLIRRKSSQQDFELIHHELREMFKNSKHDLKVTFEENKETRRLKQNRLLFLWHNHLAKHIDSVGGGTHSSEDIHEYIVSKLLGSRVISIDNNQPIVARNQTKNLKVKEFAEFLTRYEIFALETWNCQLPHPDDLYMDALCKQIQEQETDGL